MFILDTNTLIYYFKNQGRVAANMLDTSPKDIGIPAIVLFELEVGIAKSTSPQKRMKQLAELLGVITVLPFGITETKIAAHIRVDLEKNGTPIGPFDILIAATALSRQGTLITRNTKEFNRVDYLRVENWY